MMKAIEVSSQEGDWNTFIDSAQDATLYHQFGWKSVITDSFGHNCYYLAAINEMGQWQGVLPLVHMRSRLFGNFIVSIPFVNYGGLLCKNDMAARLLLAEAERFRRSCGATHVELRHIAPVLDDVPTRQHKVTMILDLASNVDEQWQAFKAKVRNQIRKAEKSGLQLIIGHLELLDEFYDVFAYNMRDLGTPVYTKHFFRNILKIFPDKTKILVVSYRDKVIAAGFACWFKDTLEIPWASSIKSYKALNPNNMLYWEAIRFSIQRGFKKFDFGRSTPHEGTYNFKKQWGALPIQLHWQYLTAEECMIPDLSPSNPKFQAAIRVWQCLPVSLTKALGPLIIRNVP